MGQTHALFATACAALRLSTEPSRRTPGTQLLRKCARAQTGHCRALSDRLGSGLCCVACLNPLAMRASCFRAYTSSDKLQLQDGELGHVSLAGQAQNPQHQRSYDQLAEAELGGLQLSGSDLSTQAA